MILVNKKYMIWLWLAILAGSLGGCAGTAVKRETSEIAASEWGQRIAVSESPPEFEPIDNRAYHYYVNGLLFEGLRDLKNASVSFGQAWKFCPESVEIGLAYARSLFRLGRDSLAVVVADRLGDECAEALLIKAQSHRRQGEAGRAKEAYLDVLPLDSNSELAYMFLAGYYQQAGVPDSAIWALTNLARVLPLVSEVQTQLGRAHLANGEVNEARTAFRQSITLDPSEENIEAWLRLAESFESQDQPDSSLAILEEALGHMPTKTGLHSEMARIWLERDSLYQALPHLWTAAKSSSDDYSIRRRLGIMLMAADSLATADSVLTSLITDGDLDPGTHFYLGRIALLKQEFVRACDELTLVTQNASSFPDAWTALGFAYQQRGQTEQQISTYQAGLEQMRDQATAIQLYFALGAAYEQDGQIDSAISTFEEILSHEPDHAASLNYLGYLLADNGIRLEYARELLERAVSLQPNNAAFLDSYGWVFYRLGDYDAAVQYLSSAAELDSDPVIYDHFGDALYARGETDRAREWWQRALEQQPDNQTIREKLSR